MPNAGWVVAAAIALRVPLVWRPLTYRGDAWRQADTASIARNFARGAFQPFHPQINWGGEGPGYVETEFQMFPLITSIFYRLFGESEAIGRSVSLAFGALALIGFWQLARRFLDERDATVALVVFAAAPLFSRYATAFMPEATMLALVVWALYFFDRWNEEQTWRLALAAGSTTALAALVKPTSLHLGVAFTLLILSTRGLRGLRRPDAIVLAAVATVPVGAWLWHARRLHLDYGNTFGVISGGDRKIGDLEMYTSLGTYIPTGLSPHAWGLLGVDAAVVFGVFALPLFLIGLRRASPPQRLIIFGTIGVVVMLLGAIRYTSKPMGSHYHLHLLPFAAIGVGIGVGHLRRLNSVAALAALRMLGAGFGIVALLGYVDGYRDFRSDEITCAAELHEISDPADLVAVISDSPSVTDNGRFENNFENPIVLYHADRYGWSVATDQLSLGHIEDLAEQGAVWLVAPDEQVLSRRPELEAALRDARRSLPGGSCMIFALPADR